MRSPAIFQNELFVQLVWIRIIKTVISFQQGVILRLHVFEKMNVLFLFLNEC